ncbi:MAG: glycosyltransferase family 4 protein [Desulfovibrionaceae bacterium]|nr:glycosyltransferase family 4 protein [Desulfovibrionaceae bacterium]
MNIAMVNAIFTAGGAARVATRMANHWAGQGHRVALFSFESGEEPPIYPLHEAITMTYLAINKVSPNLLASLRNNWRRFARIRRALRAENPDVVISFIDTANVRTILALLGTGIPVMVSERIHPAHEKIGRFWSALRLLAYPLARCLVVQTKDIAQFFRNKGIRRVRVIPNPVAPVPPTGGAPSLPRPCLLAVGRLYPQKAYDLLLNAFAVTAKVHPEWSLCIAGDGPLKAALEGQARELGLDGRVRLLGQVEDIGGVLAQADGYVLSSSYEGFPNALCEAMAAGLACVSTDCPSGPADIIRHDLNGMLTPNQDQQALEAALDRLLGDPDLRKRLGNEARRITERFSLGKVMAAWEDSLQEVASGRRKWIKTGRDG